MKISSGQLYQYISEDLKSYPDLRPESDWQQFAVAQLRRSVLSKYLESSSDAADKAALDLFLSINESQAEAPRPSQIYDDYLLGELRQELDKFWWKSGTESIVPSYHEIYLRGKVGPGSSLGAKFNDFYTKLFNSKLSATSLRLYNMYRASTTTTQLTDDAEKLRRSALGVCDVVGCSKLFFVPKKVDISRTICVEPSLNMFYQLGLADILNERLRQMYHIDMSDQPDVNRELARLGSIDGTFATIDLKSASDCLSVNVLRDILPTEFFGILNFLRTPNTQLPDGRIVALNMISTMGNGFTFPLQTLIFCAIVSSAYRLSGVPLVRNSNGRPGNFGVFGDDLAIDTRCVSKVKRLLWLLGFKVNDEKSFVEGPFRESCGYDYFRGHFVRGVYIKSLRSPQDRYVAINLLNDWSATNKVPLFRTIQYLLSSVPKHLVPPDCGADEGIHVPVFMLEHRRYDRNGAIKYRFFQNVSLKHKVRDDGSVRFRLLINPSGLILAAISGYIRSQSITLRQRVPRYVLKKGRTPCWGYIPLTRRKRRFSFPQWVTAVAGNIGLITL